MDRAFNKSAVSYAYHSQVQQRVASHLLSLLHENESANTVADVGCGVGLQGHELKKNYPKADIVLIDRAKNMCRAAALECPDLSVLHADANALPFDSSSVDCLFSSSMLQWSDCLEKTLLEWCRVLKPGGMAAISCFLQGSLHEIKKSWQAHDSVSHINTLPSFKDILQLLHALPMSIIHQETDTEIEWFSTVNDVVEHLRGVGAQTVTNASRHAGLLTPSRWQSMCKSYHELQGPNGLLPLTYEVAYVVVKRN